MLRYTALLAASKHSSPIVGTSAMNTRLRALAMLQIKKDVTLNVYTYSGIY